MKISFIKFYFDGALKETIYKIQAQNWGLWKKNLVIGVRKKYYFSLISHRRIDNFWVKFQGGWSPIFGFHPPPPPLCPPMEGGGDRGGVITPWIFNFGVHMWMGERWNFSQGESTVTL